MKTLTLDEWKKEGTEKYGEDIRNWKFVCPSCKETQTLKEFEENKVKDARDKFYFSCIGRFVENRGCNWTLGGLFQIHKTVVMSEDKKLIPVMEFSD